MAHVGNWILLSHKKKWNATICNNMDTSWEYHAKQNKSDEKSQESHDFTHMLDMGYKTESNKWANKKSKQELIDTDTMVAMRGEVGGIVKGDGYQIYGDRRRFYFEWWAYSVIHG